MTIDQLNYFLAAAKHMNYSKAAEELFIHQSTISKSIAQLEYEVGGRLFIRDGKGLALTDAGALFLQEAPAILGRLEQMLKRAQRLQTEEKMTLSVLFTNNHLSCLAPYYRRFQPQYPNVQWSPMHISHAEISSACQAVCHGKVDFAIIPEVELTSDVDTLSVRPLFSCPYQLAVSPDHPFAACRTLDLEKLSGVTIFRSHFTKLDILHQINYLLGQKLLPPIRIVDCTVADEATGVDDFIFMRVCAGEGCYLVPETAIHASGYGCFAVTIPELLAPDFLFRLFLVYRPDNTNPALSLFLRSIDDVESGFE